MASSIVSSIADMSVSSIPSETYDEDEDDDDDDEDDEDDDDLVPVALPPPAYPAGSQPPPSPPPPAPPPQTEIHGNARYVGYLAGCAVYADTNANGEYDAEEPMAMTDNFGGYELI